MMERRFDMSDFEQSLKDNADQFMLIPSKRVWNGIYNNLHPGSKWPSITVAIVLLITLVTLGNLNNSPKPGRFSKSNIALGKDKPVTSANSLDLNLGGNSTSYKNLPFSYSFNVSGTKNAITEKMEEGNIIQTNTAKDIAINSKENYELPDNRISAFIEPNKTDKSNNKNSILHNYSISNFSIPQPGNKLYNILANSNQIDQMSSSLFQQKIDENGNDEELINLFSNKNDFILKDVFNSIKNELIIPVSDEIFSFPPVDSYAFNLGKNPKTDKGNSSDIDSKNKNQKGNSAPRTHRKKNYKVEWVYYVAPVISTATFRGNGIAPPANNYSPIVIYQNPTSNGMIYYAKLGFETGAKMTYALSKKWKFITGFNLNYTDYNIISNLLHPTFATLMLNNATTGVPYSRSYITYYGNGQSLNQVALTNYNLLVSIPVGFQYEIWGNKNIQINLASTIEPSLVLKSKAYIISADKRYYVSDPSLMRRMNIIGNFAPYFTFRSRKVKWQIGPELRYQLLSTYKNYYPIKEHLIDYGIRIGISK